MKFPFYPPKKWKPLPHIIPVLADIIRAIVSFEGAAPEAAA